MYCDLALKKFKTEVCNVSFKKAIVNRPGKTRRGLEGEVDWAVTHRRGLEGEADWAVTHELSSSSASVTLDTLKVQLTLTLSQP